jgi:para-nitrobenzyl esterase
VKGLGPARSCAVAALAALAALAVSCAGAPPAAVIRGAGAWTGDPVAQTRFGLVQGFVDEDDTWSWKGIPYAAPPVGDLRWRAPREPAPWAGVRAARDYGGACTQYAPLVGGITGSEDCLFLNVWRPRTAERGLPVYVWIHGGGNSIGSASMTNEYRGNRLAHRSNMVFVSLNYRLGPFGWFTHPALREGSSAGDDSGNYGTLDIVQALRWIRDNIEAFGGDPRTVAVTGESAGGLNVLSLMICPPAEGLFHRAIAQSPPVGTHEPLDGEARAQAVLLKLLVNDRRARGPGEAAQTAAVMSPAQVRSFLRSKTDREILRCYPFSGFGMVDNPALFRDGQVLARDGFDALAVSRSAAEVPLIVGANREELKLFLAFGKDPRWKSDLAGAVARYGSQRWKAGSVDAVARRIAARPEAPRVWAYEFAWGAPDAAGASTMPCNRGRKFGAFHSLEIPFFLGHETVDVVLHPLVFTGANRPGRLALSAAMMDYAASFVRTGDPNRPGSGLPAWQPWSLEEGGPKSIVLDAGLAETRISLSGVELTEEGVFAAIDRELPADLAARTREYLQKTHYPSGSR